MAIFFIDKKSQLGEDISFLIEKYGTLIPIHEYKIRKALGLKHVFNFKIMVDSIILNLIYSCEPWTNPHYYIYTTMKVLDEDENQYILILHYEPKSIPNARIIRRNKIKRRNSNK